MKVDLIAGARPNFMKIAPIIEAIQKQQSEGVDIQFRLIHTGQHYDHKLSGSFFSDLGIPQPDNNLEAGSGTQAQQTGEIMKAFEAELLEHPCDVVLVVGDVNSTLACSIVAKKLHTDVVHVEAGIRSHDLSMPEEINRMVTDSITDYFYTTTPEAGYNLVRSGVPNDRIFHVGNTMIDTLKKNLQKLEKPAIIDELKLEKGDYLVTTLHRPANVDETRSLSELLQLIGKCSRNKKVIFPVHPRTRKNIEGLDLPDNIILVEPMRYLEFIYLVRDAMAVVTDSGGIQEETTYLGVPCLTLRKNTERPETITQGTNVLVGLDRDNIKFYFDRLFNGEWKKGEVPLLWDGNTAHRIVRSLINIYNG